jgi:hypothetical protein
MVGEGEGQPCRGYSPELLPVVTILHVDVHSMRTFIFSSHIEPSAVE